MRNEFQAVHLIFFFFRKHSLSSERDSKTSSVVIYILLVYITFETPFKFSLSEYSASINVPGRLY